MISFVILNYNTCDLTIECIKKIKNLKTSKKIKIVVVDNHTATSLELKKMRKYADKVIVTESNLGFAKANNIGVNYAKEKFDPDFVCVLNSDCMIEQTDFIDKIYEDYKKIKFDMLGPRIKSDDNLSWNPFSAYENLDKVNERIKYHTKLSKYYKYSILYFIFNVYFKLKKQRKIEDRNGLVSEKNVALHGCCIIFSKKYLSKYNDTFYNETFLFHEEEFLYYRLQKDNLISYYDCNLNVYHMEGASTSKTYQDKRKKLYFRNNEILKSLYLLKGVMENDKNI